LLCLALTSCSGAGNRERSENASWYPEEILSPDERKHEALERLARIDQMLKDENLGGVLIATAPVFSWLTAGAENIRSAAMSPQMLFITNDGRRFLITRRLEGSRLLEEDLRGQGYELAEIHWRREALGIEPGATIARLCAGRPLGADAPWPGARPLDAELAGLRVPISGGDMRKLRWLGRRCAKVVDDVCRRIQPYMTERGIEALLADALMKHAIRVSLRVASDDRIRKFGAAPPSNTATVERHVLLDLTAERWGLHVAMARAVHFGPLPEDLKESMKAAATITAGLWARTLPGTTAESILEDIEENGAAGFAEQWLRHDPGGAIGYRDPEWLPLPGSRHTVHSPQAFAWSPCAGGVRMRDTILVRDEQLEVLTEIRGWPVIEAKAFGRVYRIPAILVR
jgi:Xaa-Pro aminopeptidase